jgi:hypothetical protein
MKASSFGLQAILCMTLLVPALHAQEMTPPDREHRKDMSYEEYAKMREKMRTHMEKLHADEQQQSQDKGNSSRDQAEKPPRSSAYGQGYHSRNAEDRPETGSDSKPERPQRAERFSRGDMGRR